MKVLVTVKPVPDPCVRAGIDEIAHARRVANPHDESALDVAADLKAAGRASEVVAVCVGLAGAGEGVALAALARGADRVVWVDAGEAGPQGVALRLEAVARRERPGLILSGRLSTDSGDGQTAGRLAGLLGLPLVEGIDGAEGAETGTLATCDPRGREARPVSLWSIVAAKDKPVERVAYDVPASAADDVTRLGYSRPAERGECRMVADVSELLAALREREAGGADAFDVPEPADAPDLWLGAAAEASALATVAARNGWPLVNGVVSAHRGDDGRLVCRRLIYGGRWVEEVAVDARHGKPAVLIVPESVRSDAHRARTAELIARAATAVKAPPAPNNGGARGEAAGERGDASPSGTPPIIGGQGGPPPDLTTARVVVAGGRALGDAETFQRLVGGLAAALGGAPAATGAAVHAGIAPQEMLVGQSGRSVAPELYVALGISGADQHTGGFREARTVVAVNADPRAPVFGRADIGLVADLRAAVPKWIARLRR